MSIPATWNSVCQKGAASRTVQRQTDHHASVQESQRLRFRDLSLSGAFLWDTRDTCERLVEKGGTRSELWFILPSPPDEKRGRERERVSVVVKQESGEVRTGSSCETRGRWEILRKFHPWPVREGWERASVYHKPRPLLWKESAVKWFPLYIQENKRFKYSFCCTLAGQQLGVVTWSLRVV